MRVTVKEKRGKLITTYGGFDIREVRNYKTQGKGKSKIITSSNLAIYQGKRLVKGKMKNIKEIKAYIDGDYN